MSLIAGKQISGSVASASYALTASYALSGTGFPFSGSAVITGSLLVSGSGITGSLYGTASYAISSSYAATASVAPNYVPISVTSSMSVATASYTLNAVSSSYAATASLAPNYVLTSATASMLQPYVLSSNTSSFITNAQTSSMTVATASYVTSSRVFGPNGANSILSASYASTASYILNAVSSSYAITASFVQNAQTSSYVLNAVSASYAVTASKALSYTETDPIYTAASGNIAFINVNNIFAVTQNINNNTAGEPALQIKNLSADANLASRTGVYYTSVPANANNFVLLQWDPTTYPHRSIFVKYVIKGTISAKMRAGNLIAVSDCVDSRPDIDWNETVTNDINGDTSAITFSFQNNGSTNTLLTNNVDPSSDYEFWLEFTLL